MACCLNIYGLNIEKEITIKDKFTLEYEIMDL